jgi:hypothetical protein
MMAASRVRRRLTRRAIAALVVLNAALWAFALWGGHPRILPARNGGARPAAVSHR